MKRKAKISLIGVAVILGAGLIAFGWLLSRAVPIGTGYVAKYLCSSTFVSRRTPETVFREDIAPVNTLAKIVDYTIDRKQKIVTADSFGLFRRTALYREGFGCSLVVGTTAEEMRKQKLVEPGFMKKRLTHRADLPWPAGDQGPVNPSDIGIDTKRLEAAMDDAFSEPGPENPRKTSAVVVVYDGRLVAERYAPDFDKDMPLMGWSMSKSVTNALVGILVGQGKLDIMKPAPVPEWQKEGDPRKRITLDQLLRMSSGLRFVEKYAPLYDATEMLYDSYDFAAYAAAKPLETEPDSKWHYSSGTASIVARIVRKTVEKNYRYYYNFFFEELFEKIGMYNAVMEPDPSGTFAGSSYTMATARDWARFGLLYLQDGIWRGERILPDGWVKYSTTSTPKAPMGQHGALFWLNAGSPDDPNRRLWPSVSRDAFAAQGFQEQKLIIIPSRKLILVRLGATTDRKAWDTDVFIKSILDCLPS
jgi:CubicO group peptidase (beta-lactamase class C family)